MKRRSGEDGESRLKAISRSFSRKKLAPRHQTQTLNRREIVLQSFDLAASPSIQQEIIREYPEATILFLKVVGLHGLAKRLNT
jgi:hypothetical protein